MNEKFKKKYLTILITVTVICVIAGSVSHLTRSMSALMTQLTGSFGNGKIVFSSGKAVSAEGTLDSFDSIKINLSMGSLVVKEGNSYEYSYEFNEKLTPSLEVKNGNLIVKQSNVSVNVGNINNGKGELIITVPKGTKLDNIDVNASMGNVSVEGINAKKLDGSLSMGNLELSDSTVSDCELSLSMGNLEIKNVTADSIEAALSMGEINFDGTAEKIKLVTSMGEVTVNGVNQGKKYVK